MSAPVVKGWCPSAYHPMISGDGLIVRVRPRLNRLTRDQVLGICEVSQTFGNGWLDITSRANLQLRGVANEDHPKVTERLLSLGAIDPDEDLETRRNVTVTPNWEDGDLNTRLHSVLLAALPSLPKLPEKMGFAIDAGPYPLLSDVSADLRFERSGTADVILRADGSPTGCAVTLDTAMDAVRDLLDWFCKTHGPKTGRMGRHLKYTDLPARFTGHAPKPAGAQPVAGDVMGGQFYGAAFGKARAADLAALMHSSAASALRLTPWRLVRLEDGAETRARGFTTDPGDPMLQVHACPGKPACTQAHIETRQIALRLATHLRDRSLHVSGCAKGCARRSASDVTLVGTEQGFDLVMAGTAWDEPIRRSIRPEDVPDILRA